MYYNRDLSWLEFNYRVLREAADKTVPLYERIKFLAIFSSNLDEFFSIRYPVVLAISKLKAKNQKRIGTELPEHLLESIQRKIEDQTNDFMQILSMEIIPALEQNNVVLYFNSQVETRHNAEIRELFLSRVLSFLQPLFLNEGTLRKFEPEANRLYMVMSLKKYGASLLDHAIIKVPTDHMKRFFRLSPIGEKDYIIFIDDVIRANAGHIFPGYEIAGVYSIKFNRNADIEFEEDYRGNILKKIEKQLVRRLHGLPSRFLFESSMPRNVQLYLASFFNIDHDELFSGGRYHNLSDLSALPVINDQLCYEPWKPLHHGRLAETSDIFTEIEQGDILLHLPYHSYNPILSFFNQAAIDTGVVEIYITLYRVAADSLIANALISAAKNGKKVTAFIELKARFDEANNILWSKKMKQAGIQIIYSIPGIKVHSKIALVVRESHGHRKTYSIIGTGNFNEQTAILYTDHVLLSADGATNSELLSLFHFLRQRVMPPADAQIVFSKLLVSQFNMVARFEALVLKEIKRVTKGGAGLIRVKLNNLEEPGMIDLLYKASAAGVTLQLIVRSICCLVPGITGISEHITVKRLVDRYLEHTRIYIFGSSGEEQVYLGSADWMIRNLYHRIEVCTPVTDTRLRKELLDYFDLQWRDNDKAETINGKEAGIPVPIGNSQLSIYNYLKDKS